jgi:hypothetical protein
MSDRVFMSKRNGELVIAAPVGRIYESIYSPVAGFSIQAVDDKPMGYALFHEDELLALWTNEQIAALPLEDLGEL